MFYKRISPKQLSERLNTGGKLKFIDVREPVEYEIARVEKAELLPLSRFNEWIETLKPEDEIVVMCHHGVRSANVCMYLAQNGFENISNLEGGIDFWSIEIDETVPRY
jgi:rhodanese-related sulfurtransferase